ncbi:glycosyltransferase family 61 protein [Aminobacter aminovorans]|uniref:Tetratricopeptide repeat protein n=1 Tax=Aminobacter aminovorans TaxID=83263 RepID=A0AAC8YVB8_AMIAI|nr:glycosyltransferase family 61 protein [Aminobacter aminovorans]AMS44704.1 Tetratricopeptide repeat protein [Aminobacter aminovorans]MBB3704503.1 hypothetical protein [Aminobacter aminovorans]
MVIALTNSRLEWLVGIVQRMSILLKIKNWAKEKYKKKRNKMLRWYLNPATTSLAKVHFSACLTTVMRILYPEYRLLPISKIGTSGHDASKMWPAFSGKAFAPKYIGKQARSNAYTFPTVTARRFANATVCGTASAFVCGDEALLPDYYVATPQALIEDGTLLFAQLHSQAMVRHRPYDRIEKGICVFGSGATNWYHWLIEILPAAGYAQSLCEQFDAYPLLVPESCLQRPTFRDSLLAVAPDCQFKPMKPDLLYQVEDLVVIDSPVRGPMNFTKGQWPKITDYAQHDPALLAHRRLILDSLEIPSQTAGRRIFLARDNVRRAYNQEELLAVAADFGFEAVYPEMMTFREQVELFHSASLIVGASGAAFANMIFCQAGTRALTWIIPQYDEFCCYSNLAGLVGADLNYLFVSSAVNITSSFEAYSAAYNVDPIELRAALIALNF